MGRAAVLFDVRTGSPVTAPLMRESAPPDEDVELSERLYEAWEPHRFEWLQEAMEDEQFRNNVQWKEKDEKILRARSQFPIVVNVIVGAVEQAKAMLTANQPRFQAAAFEDSDTKTAKVIADLLQWIWYVSRGNRELKRIIDNYYVRGMGVIQVQYNPDADFGKGEIMVRALDPFDVIFDPSSTDEYGRDSSHILVVRQMTYEQFYVEYPDYRQALESAKPADKLSNYPSTDRLATEMQRFGRTSTTGDLNIKTYTVIDRYSKIVVDRHSLLMPNGYQEMFKNSSEYHARLAEPAFSIMNPQTGGITWTIEPNEVAQYDQMLRADPAGVFHMATNPQTGQQQVFAGSYRDDPYAVPGSDFILNQETVEDALIAGAVEHLTYSEQRVLRVLSVGGVKLYKEVLPCSEYPIVALMNRHNGNPYPMSDVRFVRPIQESINKMRSLIIAHAASSTNTKVFVPEGAVDKEELKAEWAKAGTGFITFNGELGTPIVAGPVPLPSELYAYEDRAKADIEAIFGIFALQQGNAEAAPSTYRGTVAVEEFGQRRIKSKLDDIEEFLNHTAKIILEWIPVVYRKPKIFRLIQPRDVPKEIRINQPQYTDYSRELESVINDVTVGRYDAMVVSGSTLPSNRWARLEYYMELYKNQIIDQIEVLRQTEVADIEGVMERFNRIQQLEQALAQAQDQIKQLKGDLQTREREAFHANQKAELAKFKSELDTQSAKAGAATQLYTQRLQDDLKSRTTEGAEELEPLALLSSGDIDGAVPTE